MPTFSSSAAAFCGPPSALAGAAIEEPEEPLDFVGPVDAKLRTRGAVARRDRHAVRPDGAKGVLIRHIVPYIDAECRPGELFHALPNPFERPPFVPGNARQQLQ